VSGSHKTAKVWDVSGDAATCVHTLEGHSSDVMSVAWSADGRHIISASSNEILAFQVSGLVDCSFSLLAHLPAWDGAMCIAIGADDLAGAPLSIGIGTGNGHIFTGELLDGEADAENAEGVA
jgi:WD40 repeat protein